MKRKVVFRPEADQDLARTYRYLRRRHVGAPVAQRFVDRLEAACLALADGVERGTRRDDISPGLRTFGVRRRATIAYRVVGDDVEVLRVLYGGRDLVKALRRFH